MFQKPQEMSRMDIDEVVEAFVRGAELAVKSGFDGIELHAAHGYLIAEFISPKSNLRVDEYSAQTDPLCFLRRIVTAIRAPGVVPANFVLGIKLNATDYVLGDNAADEARCLGHIREVASWKMVDFIEISGGNYENPDFMAETDRGSKSSSNRQALFAHFSHRALAELSSSHQAHRPMILLTGGLSTPTLMSSALSSGHADLLGIGRLSVECPHLPKILQQDEQKPFQPAASTSNLHIEKTVEAILKWLWNALLKVIRLQLPTLIGAGANMASYQIVMRKLSAIPVAQVVSARTIIEPRMIDCVQLWLYIAPGPFGIRWWTMFLMMFTGTFMLALSFS